jgi:ABC-type transport system involved in cytochrome c biogenesis permease subunit
VATLIPALLAAALISLVGSVALALGGGLLQFAGAARLALSEGVDVDDPSRPRFGARTVHFGIVASLAFALTALAARSFVTGHAPWSNLHEFSAAFGAGVMAVYLYLDRGERIRGLAPAIAIIAASLIGLSLVLDSRVDPLVPALQQPLLLTVHVGAAMLAYAISAVAFAAAAGELLQRFSGGAVRWLPSAAACRAAADRSVILAFPVLTLAIVLGSVWANLAWRSYWSNDPKELAAAATWLVYGAYLHVAGRRDRWAALAAWLLVLGFAGVLFTYLGAGLVFVGEHSYANP